MYIFPTRKRSIILEKDSLGFQSNLITGTAEKQVTSEKTHKIGGAVNGDYHVYVMEWTPDYVAWYVDEKEMRRDSIGGKLGQIEYMTQAQSLRFNLWWENNTGWVGIFKENRIPIAQYIDYVIVSSYNKETKEFTELWKDDFDSFNSARWKKGNWAIGQVTERTANVQIVEETLYLT